MQMRILLADNQSRIRFALRALLGQQSELTIVGEAADAGELLALVEATCPDMVLLAWGLHGCDPVDLLSTLRQICPHTYVIALSSRLEARQAALAAGADAFVSKTDPPSRLLSVVADCKSRK